MTPATLELINTLLFIIPLFLLLFFVFQKELKESWVMIILGLAIYLIICIISAWIYLKFMGLTTLQTLISFVTMIIGVALFTFLIKYNFWQGFFAIIVTKSYAENLRLLSHYTFFLFTGEIPGLYEPVCTIILAVFTLLTFPLIWFFFTRLLKPAFDYSRNLSFWKLLWIIPFLNNTIYSLIITPDTPIYKGDAASVFYFIPPLWTALTFTTFYILLQVIITLSRTLDLQRTLELSEIQITTQQKQNELLQTRIEETGRLRHDIRHHLLAIDGFAKNNDMEGIRSYLDEMHTRFPPQNTGIYCENPAVNAFLSYFHDLAKQAHTEMTVSVSVSEKIPFPDTDLCIILGNLLENAVEACRRMKSKERFISLNIHMPTHQTLVIIIENSYEGEIRRTSDGAFLSSKEKGRRGIGLSSVLNITETYNGVPRIEYQDGSFKISLLLSAKKQP